MKPVLLLFLSVFLFQDAPLKPNQEFDLKLKFEFKTRPHDSNRVTFTEAAARENSSAPLPFLSAELVVKTVREDEKRVKVVDNRNKIIVSKSLDKGNSLKFDLGFTDDLKDRTVPQQYSILFLNKDKKVARKISIEFEVDGSYVVNGEKRGKL